MAPRKKNPAIKSTGATSSKASPLPDWVKGKGAKPPPSYTKQQQQTAGGANSAAAAAAPGAANATASSSSAAGAPARPPPLFPPGTKTPIALLHERIQKLHSSSGWAKPNIDVRRLRSHDPAASTNVGGGGAAKADAPSTSDGGGGGVGSGGNGDGTAAVAPERWTGSVTLTKANKSDASKPFVVRLEPRREGERFEVDSKEMARHYAATYALHRLYSNLSLWQVLPHGPKQYWQDLDKFKASSPAHVAYFWAADPFEAQAKLEQEREAASRRRAAEAEAREKGDFVAPGAAGGGANGHKVGKAWGEAREVRMSAKLRGVVEAAVRDAMQLYPEAAEERQAEDDDADADADADAQAADAAEGGQAQSAVAGAARAEGPEERARSEKLRKELERLGFRAGHARAAAKWVMTARMRQGRGVGQRGGPSSAEAALLASVKQLADREAALEYLTIYTPEEDLPVALRPSLRSDSIVTDAKSGSGEQGALALRWGEERLVKGAGWPREAVQRAFAALAKAQLEVEARESVAIDLLLRWIVAPTPEAAEAATSRVVSQAKELLAASDTSARGERRQKLRDERTAVEAILGAERVRSVAGDELSLSSRDAEGGASLCYEVRIASKRPDGEDIWLRVAPGRASRYPTPAREGAPRDELALPTFSVASGTLPAYLKLALTQRLMRGFLGRARGEAGSDDGSHADWVDLAEGGEGGVVLPMVEELESCWKRICDDPPGLAEVMRSLIKPDEVQVRRAAAPAGGDAARATTGGRRGGALDGGTKEARPLRRDAALDERLSKARDAWRQSAGHAKMHAVRTALPAHASRDEILSLLQRHRVVIVAGETGCGKTTQVCQFILDQQLDLGQGSLCNVVITQPRRISAMSVAARVAEERGEKVGQGVVGYAIRGERKAGRDCRVLMTTTGVILRRLATGDPDLASLSHIIVDEVHERSVDGDFLLLELREVLKRNPKLKVIIMSATLNHLSFADYFGQAPFLEIPGRTHPVRDYYLEDVVHLSGFRAAPQNAYGARDAKASEATVERLVQGGLSEEEAQTVAALSRSERIDYDLVGATVAFVHERSAEQERRDGHARGSGGILVFCPGVGEISAAVRAIQGRVPSSQMQTMPLHANLSPDEQRKVFVPAPAGVRKCVVATNVAEASITIPDITAVVDTGRVKETRYDAEADLSRLTECWASRANARQRRGRAGRTRPGECFKLFSRLVEERRMAAEQTPEMRRVPLESVVLQARAMRGEVDLQGYLGLAMSPPSTASLDSAIRTLKDAGAMELVPGYRGKLTALGRHLSNLPLDLRLGKLLIMGALFGALSTTLSIAAIMSCKPLFNSPFEKREEANRARAKFATGNSDLLTDASAFSQWAEMRARRASNAELREWCEANFVSPSTLRDVQAARLDLCSQLVSIGFIDARYDPTAAFKRGDAASQTASAAAAASGRRQGVGWLDRHADDVPLVQSLVMAGLWPSVVRVDLPSAKFDQAAAGTVQREAEARAVKLFDQAAGRVFLHPASVLFGHNAFASSHLACFRKSASGATGGSGGGGAGGGAGGGGSKIYLRDATQAPVYALLLFGGKLQIHHLRGGVSVCTVAELEQGRNEGWVKLRAPARIGVLCKQLRRLLDARLAHAFEHPAGAGPGADDVDGMRSGADYGDDAGDAVIAAMRALISRDGLDPF